MAPKGWNSKPHNLCKNCHRTKINSNRNRGTLSGSNNYFSAALNQADEIDVISQISAISLTGVAESPLSGSVNHVGEENTACAIKLDHHIFSAGEWRKARLLNHPTMSFELSICQKDYKTFKRKCPNVGPVSVVGKLDSCAQSCLWSLKEFLDAGFRKEDLLPVNLSLAAANNSSIHIAGAIFVVSRVLPQLV